MKREYGSCRNPFLAAGRSIRNSAPPHRLAWTCIDPPWSETIRWLKLSPIPDPSFLVVKKGIEDLSRGKGELPPRVGHAQDDPAILNGGRDLEEFRPLGSLHGLAGVRDQVTSTCSIIWASTRHAARSGARFLRTAISRFRNVDKESRIASSMTTSGRRSPCGRKGLGVVHDTLDDQSHFRGGRLHLLQNAVELFLRFGLEPVDAPQARSMLEMLMLIEERGLRISCAIPRGERRATQFLRVHHRRLGLRLFRHVPEYEDGPHAAAAFPAPGRAGLDPAARPVPVDKDVPIGVEYLADRLSAASACVHPVILSAIRLTIRILSSGRWR